MISTTGRAITYTADGVQRVFPFPFAVVEASHLRVTLDGFPISGYTVALETDPDDGATLTFANAPTANGELVITRTTPITQLVDYTAGSAFNAETHENALDKLTLILQEFTDELDRSIKAPVGSNTQTRIDSSFYGQFLGFSATGDVVALPATTLIVDGGTGGGSPSTFDMADASDIDVIAVAAAGTTVITIPNPSTPILGAKVTASVGAGAYSHNVKLPAPASTGQKAFVRIVFDSAHDATINLQDHNGVTLVASGGGQNQFITDVRAVVVGASWVVEVVNRGDIGAEQFQGATYVIPANPGSVPTAAELQAAADDPNPAVIFVNNLVTFANGDFVNIPERHTLVFNAGAGLSLFNGFSNGYCGARIDCEVVTANQNQAIFPDTAPGAIFGKFGGLPRNPSWWAKRSTLNTAFYPDSWNDLQAAILAADWTAVGTASTVTNWNDATGVITVADTNNFANGDLVVFTGVPGPNLVAGRPYYVTNATAGAGTTLATFRVAQSPGLSPLSFAAGGSLACTVRKLRASTTHEVFLPRKSYQIDRPLSWCGSGARIVGNDTTITAIAGLWASYLTTSEVFGSGHAPMCIIGETGATAWGNLPSVLDRVTLDGGSIAQISGVGSRGHIPKGSSLSNIVIRNVSSHYVGWSRTWAARIGDASAADTSWLKVSGFRFTGLGASGQPLHTPGDTSAFVSGEIVGVSAQPILSGANTNGVTFRDIEWSGANVFVSLEDNAAYLRVHLDNVSGTATPRGAIVVASVNTGTDVFTSVGHGLTNGELVRHTGAGTPPTNWDTEKGYIVDNVTTDTFQVFPMPNHVGPFGFTTDNGAFTVTRPGVVVQWKSNQAAAKVTGVNVLAKGNEAFVLDGVTHDRLMVGSDANNDLTAPRSVDFLSWTSKGFMLSHDGVTRSRAFVMTGAGTQYDPPLTDTEIALMSLMAGAGAGLRSFVFRFEGNDTHVRRWKWIQMTNNDGVLGQTTDPEP